LKPALFDSNFNLKRLDTRLACNASSSFKAGPSAQGIGLSMAVASDCPQFAGKLPTYTCHFGD
jgi:hypothetical protein